MDWFDLRTKEFRYGVGLTAGASCVGIDAAFVRIRGTGPDTAVKPILLEHFPYEAAIRNRLLMSRKDAKAIGLLHFELGELFAGAVEAIQKKLSARGGDEPIEFVAIKGFPDIHIPRRGANPVSGSLELGEPAFTACRMKVPVVSDFPSKDMALGGQGGPIFSYADHVLFARKDRTVVVLHLGALATFTVLPPQLDQVISFDAAPCNLALDGAIRIITSGNRDRDVDGKTAASGVVIDEFLEYLMEHPYFGRVPPKSISREEFAPEVYLRDALMGRRDYSLEDLMATVTAAVANVIIRAYSRFIATQYEVARIILTGGGAYNLFLVSLLRKGIAGPVFRLSDEYGLPCSLVDPVRVAVLGNEALCGTMSNVPRASGASVPTCLGKITPP